MLLIRKLQRSLLDLTVRNWAKPALIERAEALTQLFETYLTPNGTVLDVGGGWGFYADPLLKRGHHLTVLDVVQPSYQRAPVVLYDGRKLPFADKSFDETLLVTVLHHMQDTESVLHEIKRVTRKRLIVVEDLYHHKFGQWWTILRDRIYNFEYFGHPCGFKTGDEWEWFFKKQHFSITARKDVYTWLSGMRILNGLFVLDIEANHE